MKSRAAKIFRRAAYFALILIVNYVKPKFFVEKS